MESLPNSPDFSRCIICQEIIGNVLGKTGKGLKNRQAFSNKISIQKYVEAINHITDTTDS